MRVIYIALAVLWVLQLATLLFAAVQEIFFPVKDDRFQGAKLWFRS